MKCIIVKITKLQKKEKSYKKEYPPYLKNKNINLIKTAQIGFYICSRFFRKGGTAKNTAFKRGIKKGFLKLLVSFEISKELAKI